MSGNSLELFVSPDGNDTGSGLGREPSSQDGPLASIGIACERARENTRPSSITITVLAGDYELDGPVVFDSRLSGTADCPITIRSESIGAARLIGGRILNESSSDDSSVPERIPAASRQHIRSYDLSAIQPGSLSARGFGREQENAHSEIFNAHRRLELARYPDTGYARIGGIPNAGDDEHGGKLGKLEEGFSIDDDRPSNWASVEDIWVHGYWGWDWADSYERVAGFDTDTNHITTHSPHGVYGFRVGQPFYYLNVPEELTRPGDYYIDHGNRVAHIWPSHPDEEIAISASVGPMLLFDDASHIHIDGFVLEYSRGGGVAVTGGTNICLRGLTVRNTGNSGIVIEGGRAHSVLSCDIYQTGETGIDVSGGNRETLARCDHEIVNNHIHHFAEWIRCYRPGIRVAGVGIRIANNHIHDAPHNAVLLSGNEHLIEKNHIHDVCHETGDSGVFYMGRDWTERGNTIRHNRIHDTHGHGLGSRAIYLDDCASGSVIHGNIFYNCTMAVFIGGGRNHRITNNIFVDCEPAIVVDGRGASEEDVWKRMVNDTMRPTFEAMNPLEPPYSVRYPDLKEVAAYYFHDLGVPPEGNLISRNICIGDWLQIREPATTKMLALQHNFTDGNPGFTDTGDRDFTLPEDAEIYELGFKPIPTDEIGLFVDLYRTRID